MAMRIYNSLSQQEEEKIDERFAEAVGLLEIVSANNHAIERIIIGVNTRYSFEWRYWYERFFLESHFYKTHYFSMGVIFRLEL